MCPFENRLLSEHFAKVNSFNHKPSELGRSLAAENRPKTWRLQYFNATSKKKLGFLL